ncbi:hypothetical protein [Tardiphaga alba]|uniref:hypothetical protein n=1 Tax=Tardiphaga alba TaxID=340268 RepID=UPI001BAC3FCC|nr:hypothetical protein [Tardiphaga alba]
MIVIDSDFPICNSNMHRRLRRIFAQNIRLGRADGFIERDEGKIKTALLRRNTYRGGALPHTL